MQTVVSDLADLLAALGGSSSREESFAMGFFFFLMVTVCAGGSFLLFSIFAIHGFFTNEEMSSVVGDIKIASILALVAAISGYIAGRWFRDDKKIDSE